MVKSALRRAFSDPEGPGETVPGSEQSGATGGAEGGELAEAAREHATTTLGDRAGQTGEAGSTSSAAGEEKKPKKTDDEKRADFSRLASKRLSRALDALDSFANLANAQSYAWDLYQESKIFTTLHEKVESLAIVFAASRTNTTGKKPARALSFTV